MALTHPPPTGHHPENISAGPQVQSHHQSNHCERPSPLTHRNWPLCYLLPLPAVRDGRLEQAGEAESTWPPSTPKLQVPARKDPETWNVWSLLQEAPGSRLGFCP